MPQQFDDHFLLKYRELLDAEGEAFDELEDACEEGNRPAFDEELAVRQATLAKKLTFLRNAGMEVPLPVA